MGRGGGGGGCRRRALLDVEGHWLRGFLAPARGDDEERVPADLGGVVLFGFGYVFLRISTEG